MNKKCINPKELFNSTQYGFSQIVTSEHGKTVFISGQVAWDENLNIVGKNDLRAQAQKAKAPPASTWVSVNGLADEDFLIEIEAQAVI
jgi:enamine deaminase RidA (YjgF/YER057c/UK114 family)